MISRFLNHAKRSRNLVRGFHTTSTSEISGFPVLNYPIEKVCPNLTENKQLNKVVMDEFHRIVGDTLKVDQKSRDTLKQRGKLPVRERIETIIDAGSPFLELSQLAGHELYPDEKVNSGGIVSGIGIIHGRYCMIVANDPTVRGGSYYPITVKKHLRAQQIAWENKLPCVYLVDSGGANLQRQDDVFPDSNHFGRIFFNQANMSAEGIPQIAIVLGSCTAGGAYVPAMSDENVIVKGNGTIFLGGPPLVKAAIGETVTAEELGGATVHCKISGVSDYFANDEKEALLYARNIIANANTTRGIAPKEAIEEPLYDPAELDYILHPDLRRPFESRALIARIVDGSRFLEFKENFGTKLVTGFARLYGHEVGIVANNGILFNQDAQKGAHFVEICGQRKIPLLFLQNITGFMIGKNSEHSGIAKDGAKLVHAVSTVKTPKITLIFGASYGAGNYGMCGRAYSPRFLFSWPQSKVAVMGGDSAAGVLTQIKAASLKNKGVTLTPEKIAEMTNEYKGMYEKQSSSYYAAARLWDDGIIAPRNTREVLGLSVMISKTKGIEESKHGVFRM